ncbi:MAG: hypothetical protein BRC30_04020 [Nanohaloarchaea archaeon SW_7_46_7]|nr:MAG: hypothetical protein BRC30_04020 [Nanohaloarchaea archaeon SW_7_46_7]
MLKEAQQKSDEIIEEAEEEKEKILEEAETEAEEIRAETEKDIKKEKEALEKQELSNARMKAKQEKLSAKQKELNRAFNEFRSELEDLDSEERKAFVENVIQETSFEVSKIRGSEEFGEALDQGKFDFEEIERPGVVLISEDGSMRRDFSFERIVENFRSEYRKDVAETLFPEGEE